MRETAAYKKYAEWSDFVVTTMLPTVAANLIGYTTNFFVDFVFEAALGVNLTIMLVITTMEEMMIEKKVSEIIRNIKIKELIKSIFAFKTMIKWNIYIYIFSW